MGSLFLGQIESIIYDISYLQRLSDTNMGVCESLCSQVVNGNQLKEVLLSDKEIGKIINLSQKDKEKYWSTIENKVWPQNTTIQLFPNNKQDQGFIYKPKFYFYQGNLKGKLPHGRGRFNYLLQKIVLDGVFKEGKLDGAAVAYAEGMQVEGRWVNGLPQYIRFQKENSEYFVQFQTDSLSKGKIIFPNGSVYKGDFRFDSQERIYVAEGKGVLQYIDGTTLQGDFQNGCLQGEGKLVSKLFGHTYTGYFRNGLFNGMGVLDMGEKGVLQVNWVDNKPHGSGEYFLNGISAKMSYQHGQRMESLVSEENK